MANEVTEIMASKEQVREDLWALVESKDIKATIDEVSAKVEGKPDPVKATYTRYEALTSKGGLAMVSGKTDKFLGFFNYGADLAARASVRQNLLASMEGPDKQYAKAAKALVAAGLFATEEEAIADFKAKAAAK